MSGTEAMRALKADPQLSRVPIVAFTAHALDAERQTFLRAGFDAVVAKPCLPDELERIVESLLTTSAAPRKAAGRTSPGRRTSERRSAPLPLTTHRMQPTR